LDSNAYKNGWYKDRTTNRCIKYVIINLSWYVIRCEMNVNHK